MKSFITVLALFFAAAIQSQTTHRTTKPVLDTVTIQDSEPVGVRDILGKPLALKNRSAFELNGYLGNGFDVVALLKSGDQVQVLSKRERTNAGNEIYKVKFMQWVGWMLASDLYPPVPPTEAELAVKMCDGFQEEAGGISFYPKTGGVWVCNGKGGAALFTIAKAKALNYLPSYANEPEIQPTGIGQSSPNPICSETGSCYGDISPRTGFPRDTYVHSYTRTDGTHVGSYYRSK